MAKDPNRVISEVHKGRYIPTQNAKRKNTNTHLADQRMIRSLKNSAVTRPFPAEQAKSVKEEIAALKQEMEFILGVTRTGLDIIDSNFNIRYIDPEWAKVYGDPTEKKCYEYFMDRSEVCPGCGIPIALKTKRIAVTEETLVKEGNRPIQVTTIPFQDGDREWLVAEVNVDISERKRSEEALRKAHEELEIRVQERTTELARANEAMQAEITQRKRTEEVLRETERFLNSIFTSIQDGISILDNDMNIIRVNPTMEQCFSHAVPLIGKKCYEAYHSRTKRCEICPTYQTIMTGKFVYEIVPKVGKGGELTGWVDLYSFPLIDTATGKMKGVIEYVRDITERKRAEATLKESEEKYRLLVENAAEAIFVAQDGMLKFTNRNTTEMIGYSKEELISKPFQEFIHPDDRGLVLNRHLKRLEGHGLPSVYPFRIVNKSGDIKWVELNVVLITWEGRPATLNFLSDITERKEAEEALQESEKKFRVLTETAASGIFIHQGERFIYVNPASETMSGYSREELLAMNFWDLVHPDFRELVKQRAQARQQGEPVPSRYELKIITKNGEERWVDLTIGMINFEGKPAILGTDFDITEHKRTEEEMRALEEQLRQSQKMEAVGRLAGGIAHDFNNLLTVIKGYSQLSLLDLKDKDPLRGNIQEIEKATQRATDLTRQLLAFSRRQILDLRVLDLSVLLTDLDKMLRRIIGEDIELVTFLSKDLGKVKIDPSQIEQVIFNLAVNARDAMPSGGKLTIETSNAELDEGYAHAHISVIPGHYVRLSVSDTGVGMSQEVKERVFEPFFTTKEKGKGTGLGLSMVYGIVKQSNGNIWVYSEPGHGTTFKIYLPRIEGELDTLHGGEETDSFPGGSETVLLVEDDELVRDLANRLLRQQGYRVLEAANGEEALRVAKEHDGETIHLLLSDIVMPQMGGKPLADQLKILRPDVKVLYTSGYADNAIVHHGVLDPGTDFLQKPFSLKTLSLKVREVLNR